MRKIFVFIAAIFVGIQLPAQKSLKQNAFYAELVGNGLFLSANYERQIHSKPGLGFHVGVGIGNNKPLFPLGAKYLFDLGKQRSFLEVGAGVTLAEQDLWEPFSVQPKTDPYKAGFIPSLGFRHHSPKGFMWRLNYTPVFIKYGDELLLFGFSIGWRV